MRERAAEFESLRVNLALVVQGDAKQAAAFCGRHGLAGRCVADPEKESYRAMGFGRTSWKDLIFASDELKARRKEVRDAGCSMDFGGAMKAHSDWMQLPGAALVGRDGKILWLHHGGHPGDLPGAAELLRIAKARAPR